MRSSEGGRDEATSVGTASTWRAAMATHLISSSSLMILTLALAAVLGKPWMLAEAAVPEVSYDFCRKGA
eukprot:1159480-Pelagomonas_calceolata.AAC.10